MFPFIGFAFASMIAVLALNTFVLTTLDTSVRITRFIIQESLGGRLPQIRNKYLATGIVIFLAYLIGATEGWQKIWPIFGATNQLIAAVALVVVSAYLVGIKRPASYTLVPAIFMIVTTIGALTWQSYQFFTMSNPNFFLGFTSIILIGLAFFVGMEGFRSLRGGNPRFRYLEPQQTS